MSELSLSDRRAIMTQSVLQPDFRDLLRRDPDAAVRRATGHAAPEGVYITVIEESADAWEFVVPAEIAGALPVAGDARGAIENDVYALLRDEPELRSRVLTDPKGFLLDRLQFDIGDAAVHVREERRDELLLILPYGDSRDELTDGALDLVAGGGNPDCQNSGSASREPVTKT